MSSLTNEDLEPVEQDKRTWTTWNYAALWIGMSICIPTYMLASGLIDQGMNWYQAVLAVALGNLIVLVPMLLNGHAGARYGIPFPVFARASFGTRGANVPAILRAIVACGWFGIQTWIGGTSLAVVVEKLFMPAWKPPEAGAAVDPADPWKGKRAPAPSFLDASLGLAETGPIAFSGAAAPGSKVTVNGVDAAVGSDGAWTVSAPRDAHHGFTVVVTDALGVASEPRFHGVPVGPLDVRVLDFSCFILFWLINMAVVWLRIDFIKKLLVVKSVFLPLATLALLAWALNAAGGLGPILEKPSKFVGPDGAFQAGPFFALFFPAVTGMVGFWATLSLNIPDFTRYATSQRAQVTGQAIGLPTSMTAVAFVGVAVTSATAIIHGAPEWNPTNVVGKFESSLAVAFAMFCVVISTLATNIAANIVSPANDFANLAPAHIGFRAGGLITGVIGILMLPWKLLQDPNGYIFSWLLGYSALLGPIGGILIADYFVLRKKQLDVKDLYRHEGRYGYSGGWNAIALGALLAGILPNIPGFLAQVKLISPGLEGIVPTLLVPLYHYAWFVGFFVSGGVYLAGMKATGGVPGGAFDADAKPAADPVKAEEPRAKPADGSGSWSRPRPQDPPIA